MTTSIVIGIVIVLLFSAKCLLYTNFAKVKQFVGTMLWVWFYGWSVVATTFELWVGISNQWKWLAISAMPICLVCLFSISKTRPWVQRSIVYVHFSYIWVYVVTQTVVLVDRPTWFWLTLIAFLVFRFGLVHDYLYHYKITLPVFYLLTCLGASGVLFNDPILTSTTDTLLYMSVMVAVVALLFFISNWVRRSLLHEPAFWAFLFIGTSMGIVVVHKVETSLWRFENMRATYWLAYTLALLFVVGVSLYGVQGTARRIIQKHKMIAIRIAIIIPLSVFLCVANYHNQIEQEKLLSITAASPVKTSASSKQERQDQFQQSGQIQNSSLPGETQAANYQTQTTQQWNWPANSDMSKAVPGQTQTSVTTYTIQDDYKKIIFSDTNIKFLRYIGCIGIAILASIVLFLPFTYLSEISFMGGSLKIQQKALEYESVANEEVKKAQAVYFAESSVLRALNDPSYPIAHYYDNNQLVVFRALNDILDQWDLMYTNSPVIKNDFSFSWGIVKFENGQSQNLKEAVANQDQPNAIRKAVHEAFKNDQKITISNKQSIAAVKIPLTQQVDFVVFMCRSTFEFNETDLLLYTACWDAVRVKAGATQGTGIPFSFDIA